MKVIKVFEYDMVVNDETDYGKFLIERNGLVEPHIVDYIGRVKPRCLLDIGACWGYYSLVAKHFGTAEIFSIEPNLANCELILQNTSRFEGCTLLPVAASDKFGWLRCNTTVADVAFVGKGGVLVPCIPLSCMDLKPDLIKSDTEGWEQFIVPDLLSFTKCPIIFEYCPRHVCYANIDQRVTLFQFINAGYKIEVLGYPSGVLTTVEALETYLASTGNWIWDLVAYA